MTDNIKTLDIYVPLIAICFGIFVILGMMLQY